MKRFTRISMFLSIFLISKVCSGIDNIDSLRSRLNMVSGFHARFNQTIVNCNNSKIVLESSGHLWFKSPNLFNLHTTRPDENILTSNGETLWFFTPLIAQVVITRVEDIDGILPLIFTADGNHDRLQQYHISQSDDTFSLSPKKSDSSLKEFIIKVRKDGIIDYFSIVDKNDQNSTYHLDFQKEDLLDPSRFSFTIPPGVVVDDQRGQM